jgi:hypothetical protein
MPALPKSVPALPPVQEKKASTMQPKVNSDHRVPTFEVSVEGISLKHQPKVYTTVWLEILCPNRISTITTCLHPKLKRYCYCQSKTTLKPFFRLFVF